MTSILGYIMLKILRLLHWRAAKRIRFTIWS